MTQIMIKITLPFIYFYKTISLFFLYFFFYSKVNKCNICGSKSHSNFFAARCNLKKLKIVSCNNCNIKYQNPQLSNIGLNIYYKYVYRSDYIFKSRNNLFKREQRRGNYIIEYLINNNISLKEKKIFEIGTGCGGIINQFKNKFNAQVEGIDLDNTTIEYGKNKGLNLKLTNLENYNPNTKFDIIILSHIIEHIADLNYFLKILHKLSHNKTIFYVEVPGLQNSKVVERNYSIQPGHIFYFDQTSLCQIFAKNNLKIFNQNNIIQMILGYEK